MSIVCYLNRTLHLYTVTILLLPSDSLKGVSYFAVPGDVSHISDIDVHHFINYCQTVFTTDNSSIA